MPPIRVGVSFDEFRTLPNVHPGQSDKDLMFLQYYYSDLPSMPYWFLTSKALPALLNRFVFDGNLDPASQDLPIRMDIWSVALW